MLFSPTSVRCTKPRTHQICKTLHKLTSYSKMASRDYTKPCVISRKRQHMWHEATETDDLILSSSHLKNVDKLIAESKKLKTPCFNNQEYSESESEDLQPLDVRMTADSGSPTPGPSKVLKKAAGTDCRLNNLHSGVSITHKSQNVKSKSSSPQPGPSRYEGNDFEPPRTSTPNEDHSNEGIISAQNKSVSRDKSDTLDKNNSQETVENEITDCSIQQIKKEIRDRRALRRIIEYEFINNIRKFLKSKSQKHFSKIGKQRNKIINRIRYIKRQRKTVDTLLELLINELDDVDNLIHKFHFMIDNFPVFS